jgi:2-polyprenyl-6-methoxyphenol hydroxylase-like FAD-dependent oxidoreductase
VRVIVVGAGIGGLSLAIGLRRAGHEPVVLEQAPRVEAVGAGITLFGNATYALDRLGVRDAVVARGSAPTRSAVLTSSGRALTELPTDLLEGVVAIHRADLHAALLDHVDDVRLDFRVEQVEQEGTRVVVRDASGVEHEGDLLVGADGLRSAVRAAISDVTPQYGGYVAWRGVVPAPAAAGELTESWGVGERFGLVDIGRGRTYWFATKNAPEGQADEPGGRKAELLRRFGGWHAPIPAMLEAVAEDAILRNDIFFLPPLPSWHDGRIVLLGDAAHAATPGVGQGAAQAIEDAVVLSSVLSRGGDVELALREYETTRQPRTRLIQKASRRMDKMAQLGHGVGARLRNAVVGHSPDRVRRGQIEPLVRYRV